MEHQQHNNIAWPLYTDTHKKTARFPGITSPYVYYGITGTSFALHIEDLALRWWTGPEAVVRYSDFLKCSVEDILKIGTCKHPIQHKNVFLHPHFFQERGIPYTRVSYFYF